MSSILSWGLIGTGNIARQFATGLNLSRRNKLACVGSRSLDSAKSFAQTFSIPQAVGDYQSVIAAPNVDVVYIALPNSLHHQWTIAALRAGKHVLCEKPIAANAAEAQEMFDVAERSGRVLIEAFMYRAHPLTHAVLQRIKDGAVGEVKLIRTSFCYLTRRIEGNIRFDAALSGGALMDIGCYCIDFSRLIAGQEPAEIRVTGRRHAGGVDDIAVGMMSFPSGILASFTCGMNLQADNTAYICGTQGYIEVPVPWKPPAQHAAYTLAHSTPPKMDGGDRTPPGALPRETQYVDAGADVFGVEADAIAATILDGKPPMMSGADSVGNMRVLDEMRRQLGIRV
jgi:predicted dehydrogenase